MRTHQKYFSLLDADGALAPRFIVVANTEGADGGASDRRRQRARAARAPRRRQVLLGPGPQARPLKPRAGARERVFHAKLGSDLDKGRGGCSAGRAAGTHVPGADPDHCGARGLLCKADLTTDMVGEFPELQGVMGRYYALHGEAAVAEAIGEHYAPQGPGDRCPTAPVSVAVALADKIDTLVGFFGIGEKPTGSKDPFALRRAALGIIRLIVENRLRLPLRPR
jgi:glycyl-tRNA synthetase beta chain